MKTELKQEMVNIHAFLIERQLIPIVYKSLEDHNLIQILIDFNEI